jgi:putative ABC transport system ATP-binding protein
MIIELKNIVPEPLILDIVKQSQHSIFNRDLKIDASKRNLIIARSGKGKTTLLNILFGIRHDFSGTYRIDNLENTAINEDFIVNFRKNECSYIFQDLQLIDDITVLENIQLKNELTNFKSNEQIQEMLSYLEMSNFQNQKVATLSYGQKQRVAILRAVCQPMKTIFLDEPFSHLDMRTIELAKSLIENELDAQNAGCLHVSLGEDYGMKYDTVIEF